MNPYNEIRLIASRIPNGTSENGLLCPFCNGGKHNERALSVSRRDDGVALFLCHRASCSKGGRVASGGSVQVNDAEPAKPSFTPRVYSGESRSLQLPELRELEQRYGLFVPDWKRVNAFIDIESGRLGIPIPGAYHANRRGVELRTLFPDPSKPKEPKTLHFRELDEQWLGWFTSDSGGMPIVLVEDVISAIKVSRHFIAVSLMGTNISYDDIIEVSKFSDNIVLCLDRDATEKAFGYQKRFKYLAPHLRVVPLQRDLKYESEERIIGIIQS
jgi:hypothetical protein